MDKNLKNIKSVADFYKALKNEVLELFHAYEHYGIFDGLDEKQKKNCLCFGNHIISLIYNPIQKRYTMQERKKYDKALNSIDGLIKSYREYIDKQDELIAQLKKKLAEVQNDTRRDRESY